VHAPSGCYDTVPRNGRHGPCLEACLLELVMVVCQAPPLLYSKSTRFFAEVPGLEIYEGLQPGTSDGVEAIEAQVPIRVVRSKICALFVSYDRRYVLNRKKRAHRLSNQDPQLLHHLLRLCLQSQCRQLYIVQ